MTRYARLRRLSLRDDVVFVQLVFFCGLVALVLRLINWRRVSEKIISGSRVKWLRAFPLLHRSYAIENLTPLVEMASRVSPRNRCLVRSIVLLWLIRARGETAELVLGVRKRDGGFEAHAWTISERGVIGDQAEAVAEFAVMTSLGNPDRL